jgi:alkyl hydroperoxide reductase subunit AhpC
MSTRLLPSINNVLETILAPLNTPAAKGHVIQPGDFFPNFTADTNTGTVDFWDWAEGSWVVLQQINDTPTLCADELLPYAFAFDQLEARNIKVLGFSSMPVSQLVELAEDVSMIAGSPLRLTLVADEAFQLSMRLGLINSTPGSSDAAFRNFLVRPDLRVQATHSSSLEIAETAQEAVNLVERMRAEDVTKHAETWQVRVRSGRIIA